VKLPRTITHDARLAGARKALREFAREIEPLAARLGCVLVQLPPSLAWAPRIARPFFAALRETVDVPAVVEPRHASWFTPAADDLLERLEIARVAADPARAPGGGEPGGWGGVAYYRLHGFPRVYYSSYDDAFVDALATRLRAHQSAGVPCWCVFDNTTLGAATGNALAVKARVEAMKKGSRRSPS
jgi:uncharacterized protein YecE (DUF72 family)